MLRQVAGVGDRVRPRPDVVAAGEDVRKLEDRRQRLERPSVSRALELAPVGGRSAVDRVAERVPEARRGERGDRVVVARLSQPREARLGSPRRPRAGRRPLAPIQPVLDRRRDGHRLLARADGVAENAAGNPAEQRQRGEREDAEHLRAGRELELPAELDRKAEGHVLVHEPVRLDVGHATGAEPVAHPVDELLGRGRTGRDADGLGVLEPAPRRSPSRRR